MTVRALERRIHKLLRNPKLSITVENLPNWKLADSTWIREDDKLNVQIRADVDRFGLIPAVIHELIHIVLDDLFSELKVNSDMEEAMVGGLEDMIWNSVQHKPRIINRWRRAINARLK